MLTLEAVNTMLYVCQGGLRLQMEFELLMSDFMEIIVDYLVGLIQSREGFQ